MGGRGENLLGRNGFYSNFHTQEVQLPPELPPNLKKLFYKFIYAAMVE